MTFALFEFATSAVIIIIAGTFLSRFADEIAERTGFGRLLIGSILLAGATSLPELTVDISAVRSGMADLAFGDLLGSSLFNLLILAILDLSTQSRGKMLSHRAARHALSGNLSAVLTAVVAMGILAQPVLGGGEVLGVSYGLCIVLLGYLMGVRMVYLDQKFSRIEAEAVGATPEHSTTSSWIYPAIGFAVAALVIVVVGPYLAHAAGEIADASGLGKTFIGTTLVAFSTSLPELVTSLAALRMGAVDLAIGNIFGSNAFNMLLFIPLDLVHRGPILAHISPHHAITGIAAIMATLIVVLGQLYQVERRRRFIEPDAYLVLIVIFGSLWIIYRMGE
jgi:cation:H+ antiporter